MPARRAPDRHAPKIQVAAAALIDLQFPKACHAALLERREVHVIEAHRTLDLESLGPRQEYNIAVRLEAFDTLDPAMGDRIGKEVDRRPLVVSDPTVPLLWRSGSRRGPTS